jgi:propanediol utilization protein
MKTKTIKVPIEISARHMHLCQKDLEKLFGKGYSLKKRNSLSQPGEFAAEETVGVENPKKKRKFEKVRIIGPLRAKSQVELSITDTFFLGIDFQVRRSGDVENTPGVTLIGPKGKVRLREGVIVPWRHIHISEKEAEETGLKNGQVVSVKTKGKRSVIFNNVKVRVSCDYKLCLHLDTDEGNAANIIKKGIGEIIL